MSEKIIEMKKKEEPSVSDILLNLYAIGVAGLGARLLTEDVNAVSAVITPSTNRNGYVNVNIAVRNKNMKLEFIKSKEVDVSNDQALTDEDLLEAAYTMLSPYMGEE